MNLTSSLRFWIGAGLVAIWLVCSALPDLLTFTKGFPFAMASTVLLPMVAYFTPLFGRSDGVVYRLFQNKAWRWVGLLFVILRIHDSITAFTNNYFPGISFLLLLRSLLQFVCMGIFCQVVAETDGVKGLLKCVIGGIVIWTLLNVGLAYAGFESTARSGDGVGYGVASFGGIDGHRMSALLGPNDNMFSLFSVYATLMGLAFLKNGWKQLDGPTQAFCFLGFITGPLAVYLVANRSSTLPLVVGVCGLLFLTTKRKAIAGLSGILILWVIAAPMVVYIVENSSFENQLPAWITNNLSRSDRDLESFGLRYYIFQYGLNLLQQGQVGLLGLGSGATDSTPAFIQYDLGLDNSGSGGAINFHQSFLTHVIQYGVISILLIVLYGAAAIRAIRQTKDHRTFLVVSCLLLALYANHTFDVILDYPLFDALLTIVFVASGCSWEPDPKRDGLAFLDTNEQAEARNAIS